MRDRARYVKEARHCAVITALAGLLLLCAACSDSSETKIRSACISAGSPATTAQRDYCVCFAKLAKKYLTKHDYAILAQVSTAYLSGDDDEARAHFVINALVDSGLTYDRATVAAMDFVFLDHRLERECQM